jgi:LytTr DNA-binding domain
MRALTGAPSDPPVAGTGRLARTSALIWAGIAAVVVAQALLLRALRHSPTPIWPELAAKLVLLACWAAVTPAIIRSVARWPLRGERAWRHAGLHLVLGAGFVVAINLLIRIPEHVGRGGLNLPALGRDLLDGVTFYGPFALIVYGTIVLIGQWLELHRPAGAPAGSLPDRLPLRIGDAVRLLPVAEIDHLEADDNYVRVHTRGDVHRVRERLADLEARLDPERFVRIHRSAIVAIARVSAVVPTRHGDWAVELDTGARLRVARGRRRILERAIAARRDGA